MIEEILKRLHEMAAKSHSPYEQLVYNCVETMILEVQEEYEPCESCVIEYE